MVNYEMCAISWGRCSLIGLLVVTTVVVVLVLLLFDFPVEGVEVFQTFFHPSSGGQKLHIRVQGHVFVRPIPDAVCAVFELLMMDGKPV